MILSLIEFKFEGRLNFYTLSAPRPSSGRDHTADYNYLMNETKRNPTSGTPQLVEATGTPTFLLFLSDGTVHNAGVWRRRQF